MTGRVEVGKHLPATKHKYCLELGTASCTTYPTPRRAAIPLESLVKLRPNGGAGALMIRMKASLLGDGEAGVR